MFHKNRTFSLVWGNFILLNVLSVQKWEGYIKLFLWKEILVVIHKNISLTGQKRWFNGTSDFPPLIYSILLCLQTPKLREWSHCNITWTLWFSIACWEGLGAGGEGDDRGWDGWMASLTRWAWVWVNSGSWWWTRRPSMLWFMGSQRVGHDWVTELNWPELIPFLVANL